MRVISYYYNYIGANPFSGYFFILTFIFNILFLVVTIITSGLLMPIILFVLTIMSLYFYLRGMFRFLDHYFQTSDIRVLFWHCLDFKYLDTNNLEYILELDKRDDVVIGHRFSKDFFKRNDGKWPSFLADDMKVLTIAFNKKNDLMIARLVL